MRDNRSVCLILEDLINLANRKRPGLMVFDTRWNNHHQTWSSRTGEWAHGTGDAPIAIGLYNGFTLVAIHVINDTSGDYELTAYGPDAFEVRGLWDELREGEDEVG